MKTMRIFCGVMLFWMVIQTGYGQTLVTKKRTYANFQGKYEAGINLLGLLTGTVDNASNAINGNVKSYSTLQVPTGILGLLSATQYLEFTTDGQHANRRTIAAHTPVTLKITLPKEVIGLLGGVEIGHFTELKTVGPSLTNRAGYRPKSGKQIAVVSGSSLLSLINGSGEFEITITPGQAYNGVYVKLSGNGLSVLLTNDLFH